jgi:transcription termination/antitermination protein NusG
MSENAFNWYVVRAITGQEKKVKSYIESELHREKLSDFVTDILIPTEKVYQIKNGKKVAKERNAFPGYILIHARLEGEVPAVIKSVTGVVGFLGSGGSPQPLRQSELNRILGTADELSEGNVASEDHYMVGEQVKVVDGPFNDFSGIIEEVNDEKKKLKVMVLIFGRRTPLELNYNQVEKLD